MHHRLLTGLAVAPLPLAMLTAEPADAASGVRAATSSGAHTWRVSPHDAGEVAVSGTATAAAVSEPTKQAADSVGMLAGGLVAGACAAFAGTAMVRRPKARRRVG